MWNFLPAEVLPVTYNIKNRYVNKLNSLFSSSHNLYSLFQCNALQELLLTPFLYEIEKVTYF